MVTADVHGQDSHDADIIRGGPNGALSLTAAPKKQAGESTPFPVAVTPKRSEGAPQAATAIG